MSMRVFSYFSGRICPETELSGHLTVRTSLWDLFKRIIFIIYSPAAYQNENRAAIAAFKQYLSTHHLTTALDLDKMEKEGTPLYSRDIARLKLTVNDLNSTTAKIEAAAYDFFNGGKMKELINSVPVGLKNNCSNCCFNSAIQLIVSDPTVVASIKKVPEKVESLQIANLRKALIQIVDSYSKAIGAKRNVVEANSQILREALSHISPLSSSSYTQEDAEQILTYILDSFIPDQDKIKMVERYEVMQGSIIKETEPKNALSHFISLGVDAGDSLQSLLDHFCDNFSDCSSDESSSSNEQVRSLQQFVQAPRVLRFQKKLFTNDLNKIDKSIAAPLEISIPLSNGSAQIYRLSCFILHIGNTMKSGHYVAYRRNLDGLQFCINDDTVRQVNQDEWNRALEKAYILSYLPIDYLDDRSALVQG